MKLKADLNKRKRKRTTNSFSKKSDDQDDDTSQNGKKTTQESDENVNGKKTRKECEDNDEKSQEINGQSMNGKENQPVTTVNQDENVSNCKNTEPSNGNELDEPCEQEEKGSDNPYDSMVKSLTNRGKGKRQVRLIESHLVQFAFGDMDSEDDEDFRPDDDDDDDDHGDDDEDTKSSSDGSDDEDKSESNSEDENRSSDESSPSELESKAEFDKETNADDVSVESIVQDLTEMENDCGSKPVVLKKPVLVCGVCLESHENANDEILECDNCGITVHEGCYGELNDEIEDDKSDSEAPTEPWFCELCKANVPTTPFCELCPNTGGIYKQTDTGKWVHLVCALYTPDVGFRNLNQFQSVVLEDIRNHLWGTRDCHICANEDFSRTGICISCDAGLCKTTFHVTCAQMNGFLSDIPDKNDVIDGDAPDLLYAHCKMHSVRHEVKKRKSSWTTFHSRLSKFKKNEIDKDRIETALICARQKYKDYRSTVSVSKSVDEQSRLISSCPEACITLARKAEMLGVSLKRDYNLNAALVSGKLSKLETNYTPDSVVYFFKRESDIRDLTKALQTHEPTLRHLRATQTQLTNESQSLQEKFDNILKEKTELQAAHVSLNKTLSSLSGKTLSMPSFLNRRSQNKQKDKLNETTQLLNTVVNKCAGCRSVEDQHLLARCGTCRKYYHLACVDPPLTRMPKSSGSYVWQCTECDSSDESSDAEDILTKRTRTKKEPEKFVPGGDKMKPVSISLDGKSSSKKKSSKKYLNINKKKKYMKKEGKKKKQSPIVQHKQSPIVQHNRKPIITNKKTKEKIDFSGECLICKEKGDSKSLVQCDTCKNYYHFKTCLDPPYSQSPKSRYYGWECEDCNDSDE